MASPEAVKEPPASRLILQDPRAWDEAQLPALRLSTELSTTRPQSGLDHETAAQMREALALKPEDIIQERAQLKKNAAQLQIAQRESAKANAQVLELKSQLQRAQDERWNNPLVYGLGAFALAGAGLWLYERKKRFAATLQESANLSALTFSRSLSSTPLEPIGLKLSPEDTVSGTSNAGSMIPVAMVSAQAAQAVAPEKRIENRTLKSDDAINFAKPKPWWHIFKRRQTGQEPSSGWQTSSQSVDSVDFYVDSGISVTQLPESKMDSPSSYLSSDSPEDSIFAQVQLLSQTRVLADEGESALEHLVDLRFAVRSLVVMEQSDNAKQLLFQHIQARPDTCAWAYLEYMSLCSAGQQREEFEVMRQRYRTQFNRLAPYWMEPHHVHRHLDGYERPLAELTAVWPSSRSRTLIENWLTGTPQQRRLFQLPAYQDLFDLYELLEELSVDQKSLEADIDFLPTVSLLDLDYEFAIDVKIDVEQDDSQRVVPTVKTGDFDVDFNLTGNASRFEPLPELPNPSLPNHSKS